MERLVAIMTATYKNEISKLLSRKKYLVLLIISVVICVGRLGINQIITRLSGQIITPTNTTMEVFPFFAEVLVPLVVFMAVTDLVATEFSDLTIKASLMRPVSRMSLMTSKILAAFTAGAAFYMFIYITCTLLLAVFGEISAVYVMNSFLAYVIDLVPLLVLVLMANTVNMIFKTPTLCVFMTLVIYAVFKYVNYFMPALNNMVFTSYMQWHKLWIGAAIPAGALITKTGIIAGSAIILFSAGYILFEKREF